jgi:hypothetical protein
MTDTNTITGQHQHYWLVNFFSQYGIGITYLLTVVILWTSSNFITQDLYNGGYNKPFLLVPRTPLKFVPGSV